MNRKRARQIANTITNAELKTMLDTARAKIKDWQATATVNKGMTKGTAWNILGKGFDVAFDHHVLVKTNMLREFGDYYFKQAPERDETDRPIPVHQEPIFTD